jgi:hypothetical protein
MQGQDFLGGRNDVPAVLRRLGNTLIRFLSIMNDLMAPTKMTAIQHRMI